MRTFDYIIVGAGSAGCVLANRLTEDRGVAVLLLEAGEPDNHLYLQMPLAWREIFRGPRYNWNYSTEPEPHVDNRKIFLPRGKVLGGSSSINGMLYVRGHPRDYDLWRQMGAEGWSYADVLPYFRKAERSWRGANEHHGGEGLLGTTANQTKTVPHDVVLESAERAGFPVTEDFCGIENEGFGNVDLTVAGGRRASTARVYLRPAQGRANLTVETGALTHRITIEHGRAVGVEYARGGQMQSVRAAREVIVAGGAYNSPQILLLSGIGPAAEIAAAGVRPVHDLPGVGKNLHEHPIAYAQFVTKGPVSFLNRLRFDRVALSVMQWWLFKTGDFANQALAGLAFLKSRPELERPDIQVFCNPVRLDAEIWFPVIKPSQGHMLEGHASLMHPESRGEVTLRSPDPADAPKILLNMLATEGDRAAMRAGLRIVRKLYATPPLAELIDHEFTPGEDVQSDDALDAYIRRVCEVGHHPVGTCAMGQGAMAVVDPELRVRGLQGLRVVDASVMPTVPGGNTNAPTIMIAEKAADLIKATEKERAAV